MFLIGCRFFTCESRTAIGRTRCLIFARAGSVPGRYGTGLLPADRPMIGLDHGQPPGVIFSVPMEITLHTPETIYSPRHVPSWLLLAGAAGTVNGV